MKGCVYVIHALTTPYYKIGITIKEIEKRLGGLQVSHPFWDLEIVVVHYCNVHRELEKTLHERYTYQRLRNSEWFELTDRELAELKTDTHNLLELVGVIEDVEESPPEPANAKKPRWKKRLTTLHDLFPSRQEDVEQVEEIEEGEKPKTKKDPEEPSDGMIYLNSRYAAAEKLSADTAREIGSALGTEKHEQEWSQALEDYADALDTYTGEHTYSLA